MIPEKVSKIIMSCATIPQLETCRQWAEYLYGHNAESYAECEKAIHHREQQLALTGSKSTLTREFIEAAHTMD